VPGTLRVNLISWGALATALSGALAATWARENMVRSSTIEKGVCPLRGSRFQRLGSQIATAVAHKLDSRRRLLNQLTRSGLLQ
jgi:hypothetical protein